ncbi:hypothetical protein HPP92_027402 [Vanilla planifolia]|uniref:Uncharacterized protein n=1 Tax=Vanilla planifolia TaxID=51239 RepID=A0A835U5F2_VANPL|nr:hypothetical protein HPP92_027402 [Vanilla planifolia]KAG0449363.1 hypothetical protein HPP92_027403 [Vanilla planifolia]
MGGKSSSLSCSCLGFSTSIEDDEQEWRQISKVRPSDEDHGSWVGEPDVDRKASDFIAKFHESRCMDAEHITV